jgi:hypothetical protein
MSNRDPLFKVVENTKSEELPIAILLTTEFAEGLSNQLVSGGAINGAFTALSHKLGELSSRVRMDLDGDDLEYDEPPEE